MEFESIASDMSDSEVVERVPCESESTVKDDASPRNISGNQITGSSEVFNDKEFSTMSPQSCLYDISDPFHSECPQNASSKSCSCVFADPIETTTVSAECNHLDSDKAILNKKETNVTTDDTLISFESPNKLAEPLNPEHFPSNTESFKRYTEESFRQALKDQELRLLRELSKKYTECEMRFAEKDLHLEHELSKIIKVNAWYFMIISEMLESVKDKSRSIINVIESKLKDLPAADDKLKASKEDLL